MTARLDGYDEYNPADADWPYGRPKDETVPGGLDGTEFVAKMIRDIYGPAYALLDAAGLIPSGTADTPAASQVLEAIANLQYSPNVDYQAGAKVRTAGGVWYFALAANGPSSTVATPGSSPGVWQSEDERAFDRAHWVNCIRESAIPNFWESIPGGQNTTWELYGQGRVTVGLTDSLVTDSRGESRQFGTAGAQDGEFRHVQTVGELAAHQHFGLGESSSRGSWPYGTIGANDRMGSNGGIDHDDNLYGTTVEGGGGPMNNMQPYITVYRYRRVS